MDAGRPRTTDEWRRRAEDWARSAAPRPGVRRNVAGGGIGDEIRPVRRSTDRPRRPATLGFGVRRDGSLVRCSARHLGAEYRRTSAAGSRREPPGAAGSRRGARSGPEPPRGQESPPTAASAPGVTAGNRRTRPRPSSAGRERACLRGDPVQGDVQRGRAGFGATAAVAEPLVLVHAGQVDARQPATGPGDDRPAKAEPFDGPARRAVRSDSAARVSQGSSVLQRFPGRLGFPGRLSSPPLPGLSIGHPT